MNENKMSGKNDACLDTSALITCRDGEPGAQRVKQILTESTKDQSVCYSSFISLMEIY